MQSRILCTSLITDYFWNFDDGTNSTSVAVPHSYSNAGSYNVALTVTSADGTDSFSQTVMVSTVQNTVSIFSWWWIVIAVLLLLLLLLLFLLWRRRDVVIIQARTSANPKCDGDGKCDNCELPPC